MSYRINLLSYFDELISNVNENRLAVIEGDKTITIKELYEASRKFASYISKCTELKRNQVIAVFLPKGIDCVIANLGILFSGNAFLNLDIKNPKERLQGIVSHCNVDTIISSSNINTSIFEKKIINIDDVHYSDQEPQKLSYQNIIDTDPLCVINTSGSTGIPKAVMLSHRGMIDFIEAVKKENLLSSSEVIGSLSPAFFDIYAFELCMLLVWGSTIVVIPDSLTAFPIKILEILKKHSVSYIFWVPTIMVNITNRDLLSEIDLPSLKKVWFAGEVFPTPKFKYWAEKLPNTEFVNMYGPIEIHVDCLYYKVPRDVSPDRPLPIGKPFFNTSVMLLKEDKTEALPGEEGELCIRGSSLAHGYYNDPEKTQKVFIQNPLNSSYPEKIYCTGDLAKIGEDGNYIFLGRKDTLIKRMGYRIELSEIEHVVVNSILGIKNACVIYHSDSKDLILYYEADEMIDDSILKKKLLEKLPRYMIPNVFCFLEQMPRNPNGKIDRKTLKEWKYNNK